MQIATDCYCVKIAQPRFSAAARKRTMFTNVTTSGQRRNLCNRNRLPKNQIKEEPLDPSDLPEDGECGLDEEPHDLPDLLVLDRVAMGCELGSKKRTLEKLAELLMDAFDDEELTDMQILDALINRERLGSTAIGDGVALPHARMPNLEEPAAAMISLPEGVDYDAIDGHKVDLIVGLLVPERCNDAHLQILRKLAIRFSDPGYRNSLRNAESQKALFTEAVQPINAS